MSEISLLFFLLIVAFVVASTVGALEAIPAGQRETLGVAARRPRVVAALWLALTALPTLGGAYAQQGGAIPLPALLVTALVAAILIGASRTGGAMADSVPLSFLVGFQAFRLPLEIILHRWVELGVAPPQMTWTGSNPDVLAGTLALVAFPAVKRWRSAAWISTAVGAFLLLNVILVVVRSLPGPLMTFSDPVLLPLRFPHVWIASVCVSGAVLWHIVALRALVGSRGDTSTPANGL